ncbi:MAG: hypothetical protein Q7U78_04190 [Gallionella sp.]|nr:hypothetical protein [Gallionella sp.]
MPNTNVKQLWILIAIAALSFLPALGFYYVGEEAITPITALEMSQRGVWLQQYMYGDAMSRSLLFNWLTITFANLLGWEHVLLTTRILTLTATLSTSLVLAWLTRHLFKNGTLAAFAALSYLTMLDLLLYHGWLSYVDPLFAFFTFSSIAALWVGVIEQRPAILTMAVIALTAAFLSKAYTAYIFYATAVLVLLFYTKPRAYLFRPVVLLIHISALIAPMIWLSLIPGGASQGKRMLFDILLKLAPSTLLDYLYRLLIYPMEVLFSLAPLPILGIYYWARKKYNPPANGTHVQLKIVSWTLLLCILPYWFAPYGGMRYLMPLYPMFALVAAYVIMQSGTHAMEIARKWIIAAIVFKFVVVLFIFPYYQDHYRGKNYNDAAIDILSITHGYPVYITDVSASGLNVAAYINKHRHPATAIQRPPHQWRDGFVLVRTAETDKIFKKYKLGGDELLLMCRGAACRQPSN